MIKTRRLTTHNVNKILSALFTDPVAETMERGENVKDGISDWNAVSNALV